MDWVVTCCRVGKDEDGFNRLTITRQDREEELGNHGREDHEEEEDDERSLPAHQRRKSNLVYPLAPAHHRNFVSIVCRVTSSCAKHALVLDVNEIHKSDGVL